MLASALIAVLQDAIDKHGDIPCELVMRDADEEWFVPVQKVIVSFQGKSCWIDG